MGSTHFVFLLVCVTLSSSAHVLPIGARITPQRRLPLEGQNTLAPGGSGGSGVYFYIRGSRPFPAVLTANCTISNSNLNRGSEPDRTTEHYARSLGLNNDDAGHILARRLGGSGVDPVNIFPQAPSINRGTYREFEAQIYGCVLNTSVIAELSWVFRYSSLAATRPVGVRYTAMFRGPGPCNGFFKDFPN
eukprot:RCo019954